ncbi:MAG TPA: hypothetical protein PLM49_06740, partial [Bacteroidales bacterium]|nr:hypothetical protein [Bacteroidales bacterium]
MKTIKFTKNFVFPIIVLLQLGLNSANAQIIHYKDFNPDIAIDDSQIEDSVKIDFNEDGVNDMKFTIFNDPYEPVPGVIIESIGCLAKPLGNSDFESLIYYNYLPSWTWGDKLDLNEIISSSQTYAEWEVILYGTIPSSYQESGTWWELPANGYFGFRFKISGEYHYGWIHLSITGSHDGVAQLNILEYAYNTHANEQILAGQTGIYLPLEAVSSVSVLDVANNGDGRDMEVTFSKVSDETLVSEYRVMVVKTPDSYSFDLASANSTENYLSVLPNGSGHVT